MKRFMKNAMARQDKPFRNWMASAIEARMSEGLQEMKVLAATKQDSKSDNPQLLIVGDIGDSWWGDSITGSDVITFLDDHSGMDVDVIIDCPGGDVFDGMTIMNTFLQFDGTLTGEIRGLCFSAASYVALGCDTLKAHETSNYGIHPAWSMTVGNQHAHADSIKWLDSIDRLIQGVYCKRADMPLAEVEDLFLGADNDGTVMTAQEAFDYGFIDEVIPLIAKTKPADDEGDDAADDPADETTEESSDEPSDKGQAEYLALLSRMKNRGRRQRAAQAAALVTKYQET